MFAGKKIVVTGACGTIGQNLFGKLAELLGDDGDLIGVDINEEAIFFHQRLTQNKNNVNLFCYDILNESAMRQLLSGADLVFHCAALKHVSIGENSTNQVVRTNIYALQTLVNLCIEFNVDKFVFTSSDKAVNPTTVMGTTKLLGEKIVTSANKHSKTTFITTRFGNVIGSSGSVLPVFKSQLEMNEDVTVTDARMSRYIMTISEASKFVLKAAEFGTGGEVFISQMKAIKIIDLAEALIKHRASYSDTSSQIKIIGPSANEKLYEELLTKEELSTCYEMDDLLIVDNSQKYNGALKSVNKDLKINSDQDVYLSQQEIVSYLVSNNLL